PDAQVYERAAVLSDKLLAQEWLHRQLEQMRQANTMKPTLYPVTGHSGATVWYLLDGGRAVAAVPPDGPAPGPGPGLLEQLRAKARTRRIRLGAPDAGVQLLAAWFRRFPDERQRLIEMGV